MSASLRIAVSGLAATYPFGGVFWDYLQYPMGFQRLGHDVLYVEDTGKWCYDPAGETFVESGERNVEKLAVHLRRLVPGMAGRWFYRDATGRDFGRPWPDVVEFCRTADLFLHVSASCLMRDEYCAARTVAFLDSDPLYTQVGLLRDEGEERLAWWKDRHQVFFTFGENVGRADCHVPTATIEWIPTRQPVVIDQFPSVAPAERRNVLTTVASWEPTEKGPVWDGATYSGKGTEFLRFLDLPGRSPLPIEVAMSGPAPREKLEAAGWKVVDARTVSGDPVAYRDYLGRSRAELGIAKNAYIASRSGWFSGRSACYLALGVPVLAQDTGFGRVLPTGEGLLSFSTPDEAAAALEALEAEYERHVRAARSIARQYFDAERVLKQLLEDAAASRSSG